MRIGQGFDVHAFEPGEGLPVGGVWMPHDQGVRAHSDGDVLLHAISDALLGAAALGDIGHFFPDTDATWSGADSRELLRQVARAVQDAGYQPVNVDSTVIAERPKMAPHLDAMRQNIAEDLGVAMGAVSVKATTTEKLGFTGRGEGIAAQAVCLIDRINP